MIGDLFADVRDLVEKSPLHGRGTFLLNIRYAVDDHGVLFELVFFPDQDRPKIVAKWLIDLMKLAEEGATHRELVQSGLDAVHEAYLARGY
jgi:hypothetical protein